MADMQFASHRILSELTGRGLYPTGMSGSVGLEP